MKNTFNSQNITEVLLLAVRCYEAMGKHKEALSFFEKNKTRIVDMVARHDYSGRLNFKAGNNSKALESYESLLELNTANLETYYKIFEVKGIKLKEGEALSSADQKNFKKFVHEYIEKAPKATAHLRLGIRFTTGDDFSELLAQYVKPLLIKGVPSLMQDLKEFYNEVDKVNRIGSLLDSYLESMEKEMTLSPDDEEE